MSGCVDRRRADDGGIQIAVLHHALDPIEAAAAHAFAQSRSPLRRGVRDRDDLGFVALFEGLHVGLRDRAGAYDAEFQFFLHLVSPHSSKTDSRILVAM